MTVIPASCTFAGTGGFLSIAVGLLMTAVLHFVADDSDPWGLVRQYVAPLCPGSYLALSHITRDKLRTRLIRLWYRLSEPRQNPFSAFEVNYAVRPQRAQTRPAL